MHIIQKPIEPKKASFSDISNLRFANEDETRIDMDVVHSEYGEMPFTAYRDDVEQHSRELYDYAIREMKDKILPYDLFFYFPEHPNNPKNVIEVIEV